MAKKDKKIQANNDDSGFSDIVDKFKANPALYIGSIIILILVVITFVGGDFLSGGRRYVQKGGGDLIFGYYDNVPISWVPGNKLSQYYEQYVMNYRNQVDINDPEISRILWSKAFEDAAVQIAIVQEMKRSGFEIPERLVDREVAKQFLDERGNFSITIYRQKSESEHLTLWRQTQEDMAVMHFYNDLFGLLAPEGEKEFFAKMGSDMRTLELVSFQVDDFPESEYLVFAKANPDLFKSAHLSIITVNSSEKAAKKILESIKDGTMTFEDAARAQSQDNFADRGGDMGIQYVYDLEKGITDAQVRESILSLGKGELSSVVKLENSWVFFRMEEEIKQVDFDDSAVMDRVRSYMRNYERGRMEDWAIAQADEFIADAKAEGFDNAARKNKKVKASIGPLPLNYGGVELFTVLPSFNVPELRQEIMGLSKNINFWKIAFSTPLNTPSKPLVQGSKVLVLLPVGQIDNDKEKAEEISSIFSDSWPYKITAQSLGPYFMKSPRMDNRFQETFARFFY